MRNNSSIPNKIGKCPVCGKGDIVHTAYGYQCNYFKDMHDNCKFFIFNSYHGTLLNEDTVRQLIEQGETDELQFYNTDGNPFRAKLKIMDNKVQTYFDNKYINGKCPRCGGRVKITERGYACENYWNSKDRCLMFLPKRLCNRDISQQEAEDFLNGKEQILDNFSSNAGKCFSSVITQREDGSITVSSKVCKCPKCGGDIHIGGKAFNCSNYKAKDVQCRFKVWRTIAGHAVTLQEVRDLCEKGITEETDFFLQDGTVVRKRLAIGKDWEIVLV